MVCVESIAGFSDFLQLPRISCVIKCSYYYVDIAFKLVAHLVTWTFITLLHLILKQLGILKRTIKNVSVWQIQLVLLYITILFSKKGIKNFAEHLLYFYK